MDSQIDHKALLKLDESEGGIFKLLVASDKTIAMRGLDYRAPINGIMLLICHSFSHHREAQQAAYRVGRQKDPCKRLILKDLSLVDEVGQSDYQTKLNKFIMATTKRPVIKMCPKIKSK